MTRHKLIDCIKMALEDYDGRSIEEQAEQVANLIRLAARMETKAEGEPVVWPIDVPKKVTDEPKKVPALPTSPGVVLREELGKALAPPKIVPSPRMDRSGDSFAGPPPPKEVKPIRLDSVKSQKEQELPEDVWDVQSLRNEVARLSPETIEWDVPGSGAHIMLERNVICAPAMKGVRLVYKHPNFGSDMEVSEDFFTYQEDIEALVGPAMDRIIAAAQKMYRPRPREMAPSAPVKTGNVSFDSNNPMWNPGGSV
jgi:hypothetical protein